MQSWRYVRLFADADGESHFADVEVALEPTDFAPPAAPLGVAPLFSAQRCRLLGLPADWGGGVPHPSPSRQLLCNLSGAYEVTASDGEVRVFPAGSVLLLEDTSGKGHSTRVLGAIEVEIIAIALGDG